MKIEARTIALLLALIVVAAFAVPTTLAGGPKVKVDGEGKLNLTEKNKIEFKAENKSGDLKGHLHFDVNLSTGKIKVKGNEVQGFPSR